MLEEQFEGISRRMGKKEEKTNVMRLLEQNGITYAAHLYADTDAIAGMDVAKVLNEEPERVFKTLVTSGSPRQYYVFVVPVNSELDLKKAAAAVGEKSIEMIRAKELLPLTGYVHGGCSPIGMKKQFRTVVDETAQLFDTIMYSGGKIGYQVETDPKDLEKMIPLTYADITKQ